MRLRGKFRKILNRYAIGSITPMGAAATEAAYREGGPWLDELLVYIRGNMELVANYAQEHLPELKVVIPEATYLLWIDFRGMGMSRGLKSLPGSRGKAWIKQRGGLREGRRRFYAHEPGLHACHRSGGVVSSA